MKPVRAHGLLLCALLLGAVAAATAQVTTGTIFGTIRDESQAIVPGVSIAVKHVDTGLTRMLTSDLEGRYRASNLPLGDYEISAEMSGFRSAVRRGVSLTVGREADVSFVLSIGNVAETVEVSAEAPLVETTKAEVADLVNQQQIQELPLNARSFTDLALLQPGVMTRSRNTAFSGTSGGGVRLAINGARPTNTAFFLDGTDIKDAFGRTPGSAAGTNLGVDTVREFQVLTNSFSAQFGGSGGVINVVTKSGGNQLHGSGFYFLRHSNLDARNFFDRGSDPPPFHRHQGGFTLGGPIKQDRTFFFGTYERLTQLLNNTTTINVPSAAVHANLNVHPTTRKYLNAMPRPNGAPIDANRGEYITEREEPIDQHYIMVRGDQQLTEKDSVFVRYTFDKANNETPLPFPEFFVPAETRLQYVTGEYSRLISASLLNNLRMSVNRSVVNMSNQVEGLDESFNLIPLPGRVPPQIQVTGLASWGNRGFDDRYWGLTNWQFAEKLSWTKGSHAMAAGADLALVRLSGYSASRLHGRIRFNSLNDFINGVPLAWEYLVPGTGSDPAPGEDTRQFRQQQYAFFVQDDYRPLSNLTLNLGLRWEFVDTPTEKDGRISNLRDFTDRTETIGDPLFNPEKANFAPRLGVAWDPGSDGRTAVRAGFGMFFQPLNYATWQIVAVQNAPFFIRAQIDNPAWPPPFSSGLNNLPPGNPTPIEFNPKTPWYMQYNVTLQRQLQGEVVVSLTYAGGRGRNLASTMNPNLARFETRPDGSKFFPDPIARAVRINPAYAAIELRAFNLESNYNSLQFRVNKRFGSGLQLQSSYAFAKNLDNGSETQGTALMDPYDPDRDYSLSDWDVRHNWSFNALYELPFFRQRGGLAKAIAGGWQLSGILNATTGNPFNVIDGFDRSRSLNVLSASANNDRPNLRPGANSNPVLEGGDPAIRYADVGAFELQQEGLHGNLGRNTLIGPGLFTVDMSLVKNIPFSESGRLQFRVEYFNIFNHTNFGTPTNSAFVNPTAANPSGANANFGRITTTATTARQGQIALKLLF